MMFGFLRRKDKEESPEILEAKRELRRLEQTAKTDEITRRRLDARLTALQAELDNLTRRGGNLARH